MGFRHERDDGAASGGQGADGCAGAIAEDALVFTTAGRWRGEQKAVRKMPSFSEWLPGWRRDLLRMLEFDWWVRGEGRRRLARWLSR